MKKKSKSTERSLISFLSVVMALTCTAAVQTVDPLDNSLIFKLGMAGDVNANGRVDAGEVFNAMAVSGAHSDTTEIRTPAVDAKPLVFTNVSYRIGGEGPQRYEHVGEGLYFPFSTKIEDGKLYASPASVTFNTDMPIGKVFTIFTRMRWDGTNDVESVKGMDAQSLRILCRYDWGYSNNGFAICMTTRGNTWGFGFYLGTHQNGLLGDSEFLTGDWVDAFVTYAHNPETGKTKIYSYAYSTTNDTPYRHVSAVRETDTSFYYTDNKATHALTLGAWGASSSWVHVLNGDGSKGANSDYVKNFHGVIKDFRIWNRELTEEERRMVISDTYGSKWRVGAANGSADEFAGDGSSELAEEYAPDSMPWHKMRRELTAENPSLTLKGVWSAQDAQQPVLPRVLSVKPIFTGVSGAATVRVDVNDATVGTFDLKTTLGRNIYIPFQFWNIAEGEDVTVALTRVGNTEGSIAIDSIELGGSWQTGVRGGNNSEFARTEWEYNCHFAGSPKSSNMVKTIYGPMSDYWGTRVDFKVHIPEEVALRCPFVFETAISSVNGNSGSVPGKQKLAVYVNDELKMTFDELKQGMPIRLEFGPGELKGGLNVFRLRNMSDRADVSGTCWLQFDYYSLTCKRPVLGPVVIMR